MASRPRVPVKFSFHGAPARPVALTGDFPDWKYPVTMSEGPTGMYSVEVRLEPGIYRYKFLVDRRRYVDPPDAAIIDRAEGPLNGIVIVGGTQPPLYFAPDRRHVALYEDGRLIVHGEVDAGTEVPHTLWLQPTATSLELQLTCIAIKSGIERGGKRQFKAEHRFTPSEPSCHTMSAQRELALNLGLRVHEHGHENENENEHKREHENKREHEHGHGHEYKHEHENKRERVEPNIEADRANDLTWFGFTGHPSFCFTLPPARTASGQPPAWLDGAIFYAIFIDRWRRASTLPHPRAQPRSDRSMRDRFYGGDLSAITEDLPKLAELGITAIVLTPIHPSPTPHRYDGIDLLAIDPLIGGERAFRELIDAAHKLGLKVVADLSATHVSDKHSAFVDVLEKQAASSFAPWFRIRSFPVVPFKTFGNYDYYYDRPDLPLLNLDPGSPARAHALEAGLRLVEMGADGLRLDALNDAPASFWEELRMRARKLRPDLLLLGEIVTDRPVRFAEDRGIDTGTDFQHREAMIEFFAEDRIDASEFWNRVSFAEHRLGPFDPSFRLLFLDNHDTERFLSTTQDRSRLPVALAYLLFRPEPVWLTYGTEYELHAGLGRVERLDDAWHERLPMPDEREAGTPPLASLIQKLTRLRRELFSKAKEVRCVHAAGRRLVLERDLDDGWLRLIINTENSHEARVSKESEAFETFEGLEDFEEVCHADLDLNSARGHRPSHSHSHSHERVRATEVFSYGVENEVSGDERKTNTRGATARILHLRRDVG